MVLTQLGEEEQAFQMHEGERTAAARTSRDTYIGVLDVYCPCCRSTDAGFTPRYGDSILQLRTVTLFTRFGQHKVGRDQFHICIKARRRSAVVEAKGLRLVAPSAHRRVRVGRRRVVHHPGYAVEVVQLG